MEQALELQSENAELRKLLEEIGAAMNLIMDRHRKQVHQLIQQCSRVTEDAFAQQQHDQKKALAYEEVPPLTSLLS
eukprot:m.87346 g.87346  ORF g.87346 m.87346 type:complete len:76 (+) comp50968_c0_seq2:385-612(+)